MSNTQVVVRNVYRDAAKHASLSSSDQADIQIDDNAAVSESDNGAYVSVWKWIDGPEGNYYDAARQYILDGMLELDEDATVSEADNGAYVQFWLWMSDSEAVDHIFAEARDHEKETGQQFFEVMAQNFLPVDDGLGSALQFAELNSLSREERRSRFNGGPLSPQGLYEQVQHAIQGSPVDADRPRDRA